MVLDRLRLQRHCLASAFRISKIILLISTAGSVSIAQSVAEAPGENAIKLLFDVVAAKSTDLMKEKDRVSSDPSEFAAKLAEANRLQKIFQPLNDRYFKLSSSKEKDETKLSIAKAQAHDAREKFDAAENDLMNTFPYTYYALAAWSATRKRGDPLSTKISKDTVAQMFNALKAEPLGTILWADECFVPDGSDVKLSESCVKRVIDICDSELESHDGILQHKSIDEALQVTGTDIPNLAAYKALHVRKDPTDGQEVSRLPQAEFWSSIEESKFSVCRAYSLKHIDFKQKIVNFYDGDPAWMRDFYYGNTLSLSETKKRCISEKPDNLVSKIAALHAMAPNSYRDNQLSNAIKECQRAIAEYCQPVFMSKDNLAVLSYPTRNCEMRDVTATDIESDLKSWKETGLEQAAIIGHSELLDQINLCQEASEKGYFWHFRPYKVPKNCKRPSQPKK